MTQNAALPVSAGKLVAIVCAAQVLAQVGAYTWPALLPGFIDRWGLDNADAGWITGIFYASYTLFVPVLVTLTDRIDPRSVYLTGVALTVISHAGFAFRFMQTGSGRRWRFACSRASAGPEPT